MFESVKSFSFAKAVVVMVVGGFLAKAALDFYSTPGDFTVFARGSNEQRGEYGGDLGFLRQYHVKPAVAGESNHYFDLWSPGALPALAKVNGLTNNRALFIDSHGKAGFLWHGRGYGLYPRETLLKPDERAPNFSAADFAAVLGAQASAEIHNVIIAGCNEEGRFRSQEWRRHFVNATNITYMTAGKLSFKPMYYQAIVTPSAEIQQLHGKMRVSSERTQCVIENAPSAETEPLGVYVADLYLPREQNAFRTQRAGRELLEPSCAPGTESQGASHPKSGKGKRLKRAK